MLLPLICPSAVTLDVSKNAIGKIGIEVRRDIYLINLIFLKNFQQNKHIASILPIKECKIEYLNLEENMLGNQNVCTLLQALAKNRTLRVLNLSKNYLSEIIANDLRTVLEGGQLRELYLHWNQLKASFGKTIFQMLSEEDELRVLDLSNNSLGSGSGSGSTGDE